MDHNTFFDATASAGIPAGPLYVTFPHKLGLDILRACKRYARAFEKRVPGLKHAAALEVIAKAVAQEHWHALQTRLNFLVEHYAPAETGHRAPLDLNHFAPLLPALVLLSPSARDLAPRPEALKGMETLASQLAGRLALSRDHALDTVSSVHGANSWQELLARRPEASKDPLYGFYVEPSGDGNFYESPSCSVLVEEQDGFFDQYSHRPEDQKKKCLEHVRLTLKARPDFLEGYLALGSILCLEGEFWEGGLALKTGIERAQALIPKGFKGEISWSDITNRFYHRLLYAQMEWMADCGQIRKAIALARKQLRLNPDDNLGLRFYLPALLCAGEQFIAAEKPIARLANNNNNGEACLVRSMYYLLTGKDHEGTAAFLQSLFVMPKLRFILNNTGMTEVEEKKTRRGVSPDSLAVWSLKSVVLRRFPALDRHFWTLLQLPVVIAEERRLELLFETERQAAIPYGIRTWEKETQNAAGALALKLPTFNAKR